MQYTEAIAAIKSYTSEMASTTPNKLTACGKPLRRMHVCRISFYQVKDQQESLRYTDFSILIPNKTRTSY